LPISRHKQASPINGKAEATKNWEPRAPAGQAGMTKGALLHGKQIGNRINPVRAPFILSNDGKAFFGQDRVAVLTKTECILSTMNVSSTECERPAL